MTIHRTRDRLGVAAACAAVVLSLGTACGSEVAPPSQDLGGGASPSAPGPEVTVPPFDDRPCAESGVVARREHRPVCAS